MRHTSLRRASEFGVSSKAPPHLVAFYNEEGHWGDILTRIPKEVTLFLGYLFQYPMTCSHESHDYTLTHLIFGTYLELSDID
jgi:hypothetical protein